MLKKNGLGYPNGEKQVSLMITREDTAGRKATWKEYQPNDADELALCVTVEIKGVCICRSSATKALRNGMRHGKNGTGVWHGATRLLLRRTCGKLRHTGATSLCTSRRTRTTHIPGRGYSFTRNFCRWCD